MKRMWFAIVFAGAGFGASIAMFAYSTGYKDGIKSQEIDVRSLIEGMDIQPLTLTHPKCKMCGAEDPDVSAAQGVVVDYLCPQCRRDVTHD